MNPYCLLAITVFVALLAWFAIADQRERDERRRRREQ